MERVYDHTNTRQVTSVLNQVVSQFDNCGSVSLANSTTTTTVSNSKINSQSKIFLQARTTAAATASASTFISAINDGSFVINHASATTARTFDYVVFNV
ncbi:hypothetical protein CPJ18_22125 [Agrobacterium rosae]|uniref:Uncharacterized protein n=1 Tax=Agrobacterium rosae TaxID=1972867 RepID=A0AAE5RU35_9HYPH|nr:hypothetical protein DXM21_14300 [Agrobacterium rosae]KAA3518964.1 hypothetical protein DXM25_13715 [Agrobacterium rosae]MQB49309.1 hypothetical protein [Agrobacterium rosae]POO49150.1 hypothetical protein CPJ18_22125 [Agrobacterium rosae]